MIQYGKKVNTGVTAGILIGAVFLSVVLFLITKVEEKTQELYYLKLFNAEDSSVELLKK